MTDAALACALARIELALDELREDVQALRAPVPVRDDAAAVLAVLLSEIEGAVAGRAFSTAELILHSALPIAADLRAAILACVGALNAQRLGKRLKAAEGVNVGGLTVRRLGQDASGVIWSIEVWK